MLKPCWKKIITETLESYLCKAVSVSYSPWNCTFFWPESIVTKPFMFDRSRKNVSVLQSCSEILLDLKQGMAGADWESSEMTSRKKCGTKKG